MLGTSCISPSIRSSFGVSRENSHDAAPWPGRFHRRVGPPFILTCSPGGQWACSQAQILRPTEQVGPESHTAERRSWSPGSHCLPQALPSPGSSCPAGSQSQT